MQARPEALVHDDSTSYDLLYRTTLDSDILLGDDRPRDPDQTFGEPADHHVGAVLRDLGPPHRLRSADRHGHALHFIPVRLSGKEDDQP